MARAAQRLHISRPAAAKRIRQLEVLAGAQLLQRGRRGVTATEAGVRLYPAARELLDKRDEVMRALAGGAPADTLRFAGVQRLLSPVPTPPPEQRLRDTESLFAAVFHATSDGILLADIEDGFICEANQAAVELTGYGQEELRGRRLAELGLWDDGAPDGWLREAVRTRRSGALELVLRTRQGERRPVRARLTAVEVQARWYLLVTLQPLPQALSPARLAASPSRAISRRLQSRFLTALLRGSPRAAEAAADEALEGGADVPAVHAQLLTPAMRAVGEGWAQGRVAIADEHLATEICHEIAARLLWRVVREPAGTRGRVLMAAVPGERHVLGLRLASDILEGAGYEVLYLGADVPEQSLAHACLGHRPAVVGLTVGMPSAIPALRRVVARLSGLSEAPPVMVGGRMASLAADGLPVVFVEDCERVLGIVQGLANGRSPARG